MSEEKYYWKWKNTIIDFNTISDEKDEYIKYMTKKDLVFRYLGTPDEDIHEWYNGGYSSEYNTALRYAKELGLVEDYIDYEEIRCQLQQKENIIKEIREYLTSYESISTIEGLEDIEKNKDLDEKTLNEMIRRYLIGHDKILEILDKGSDVK